MWQVKLAGHQLKTRPVNLRSQSGKESEAGRVKRSERCEQDSTESQGEEQ